jgi:hypothetical protein
MIAISLDAQSDKVDLQEELFEELNTTDPKGFHLGKYHIHCMYCGVM